MAKLLCTITTKVYSDGKVEVSTEPYKDPDAAEEARRVALGLDPVTGKGIFGLG